MKFRFCGDLEPPEWFLSEIAVVARVSSISVKLLCNHVVDYILHNQIDFSKVKSLTQETIEDVADIKAVVSTFHFIIYQATKFNMNVSTLSTEIQQLGIPKDNAEAICRCYCKHKEELTAGLLRQSLKGPILSDINWRVDHVIASKHSQTLNQQMVHLQLHQFDPVTKKSNDICVEMSRSQFYLLYNALKESYKCLSSIP